MHKSTVGVVPRENSEVEAYVGESTEVGSQTRVALTLAGGLAADHDEAASVVYLDVLGLLKEHVLAIPIYVRRAHTLSVSPTALYLSRRKGAVTGRLFLRTEQVSLSSVRCTVVPSNACEARLDPDGSIEATVSNGELAPQCFTIVVTCNGTDIRTVPVYLTNAEVLGNQSDTR